MPAGRLVPQWRQSEFVTSASLLAPSKFCTASASISPMANSSSWSGRRAAASRRLLRMIAGLEGITGGEISIGERVVNDVAAEGARHRDGVPELRALPAHDGRREHGLLADAEERAEGRDRQPRQRAPPRSSASYRCSTAIRASSPAASASASPWAAPSCAIPQVFLFDEPLSNLDAKLRVQMRAEIKELHQRLKTTTVYVTHDQIEAMTMADKIVVMHDGIVEQIGAPLELYDRPDNLFVAGFIGSPAMNMLKGTTRRRRLARVPGRRRHRPAAGHRHVSGQGRVRRARRCARNTCRLAEDGIPDRRSSWSSRPVPRPRSSGARRAARRSSRISASAMTFEPGETIRLAVDREPDPSLRRRNRRAALRALTGQKAQRKNASWKHRRKRP